jgi:hypothetical protein
MSDNKILSFEEFTKSNNATGDMTGDNYPSQDDFSGDADQLPAPAEEVETGETDRNVPNNMVDYVEDDEAEPKADVQIEADDDIDQHLD